MTATSKSLELVLVWHMHQPDFRDAATGQYRLPWVYLHAIKDYVDMAAHLERHPKVHAVVNFVPILLDQLEDYAQQFETGNIRDPLLAALAAPRIDAEDAATRELILDRCFRANHEKMIAPFPEYQRLHSVFQLIEQSGAGASTYLSAQYLSDLLTWYHLSWTGESVRRTHTLPVQLMSKGRGFTHQDRKQLFDLYGRLMVDLLPRWRRLTESGQVEISSTPHYHPIGPLFLDFTAARETQRDLPLPKHNFYPGGRQRLHAHIDWAIASHQKRFGAAPAGFWPAEGAISAPFLKVLEEHNVGWAASGEAVLRASLGVDSKASRSEFLYRGYRHGNTTCFFRDDRLSDLIGFEYSKWHGRDATAHFIGELDRIGLESAGERAPLVSVILDGENAWEYYPYNGYFFLDDLYASLEAHGDIRTTTYRDVLRDKPATDFASLNRVVAGSWVYGNLATWIGDGQKNAAWDLLCDAKRNYDWIIANGKLSEPEVAAASKQLAVCEGSDWFWWFGDYNPRASVESMDRVFRADLAHLYELLKLPVPDALSMPISHGAVAAAEMGGAMRRAS